MKRLCLAVAAFLPALAGSQTTAQAIGANKGITLVVDGSPKSIPFNKTVDFTVDAVGNYRILVSTVERSHYSTKNVDWANVSGVSMEDKSGNILGVWTHGTRPSVFTFTPPGLRIDYWESTPVSLVPAENCTLSIAGAGTAFGQPEKAEVVIRVERLE